jgi:hypothetical protein
VYQILFYAECSSVEYLNAKDENVHVIRVMKALTKMLHMCFCCIYACRQLHFSGLQEYINIIPVPITRISRIFSMSCILEKRGRNRLMILPLFL